MKNQCSPEKYVTDNSLKPKHMYTSIIETEVVYWDKNIFWERHSAYQKQLGTNQ